MKALIFDTETTGLLDSRLIPIEKQPEVIELYACLVDLKTGEQTFEFNHLIKPKKPVSAKITRITSITNEMLENAQPFEAYAQDIVNFLENAPCVIAHNLSFDSEMIDIEMDRLGVKVAWPRRKLCTVEATIHLKGFRLNLTGLHEHLFSEGFPEAHRAKNDVVALRRCAIELFKRGEI